MDLQIQPTWTYLLVASSLLFLVAACSGESDPADRESASVSQAEVEPERGLHRTYSVTRLSEPVEINSVWDKAPWNGIEPLKIQHHMGDEPEHRPGVQAKVAYDEDAIYVIYRVEDQYVRCALTEYQAPVFRDSCVEFFFTPSNDLADGYFNLEMNCIGNALFHFQRGEGEQRERARLSYEHFQELTIAHSVEPEMVAEEHEEPLLWTLEYRIPFDMLEEYSPITRPTSGVEWRANFFKIGDHTSHPHWLTWSVIERERPAFHVPEYFGTLVFE